MVKAKPMLFNSAPGKLPFKFSHALCLQVKGAYDQVNVELMALKGTLAQSQQMEKKSGCLVQELTVVVKEQKKRISELVRSKRDTVTDLKVLRSAWQLLIYKKFSLEIQIN